MDFFEAAERRGSYRGTFLDEPVPEADLLQMLRAATQAPSGYNFQTTKFLVVRDAELRSSIAALVPSPAVETAPVLILPLSHGKVSPASGLSFEIEDYAAATENLLLAIAALGYASVWIDGRMKLEGCREKLHALLGVPEGLTVRAVLPVGRPSGAVTQKEKLPVSERVVYDRF